MDEYLKTSHKIRGAATCHKCKEDIEWPQGTGWFTALGSGVYLFHCDPCYAEGI